MFLCNYVKQGQAKMESQMDIKACTHLKQGVGTEMR